MALAALAAVAVLVPDRADAVATVAGAKPRPRGMTALVIAYGLFGFGYVITATFIVAIVRGSESVRALEPWVWIVFGLTAAPSVALWTWAGRRVGIARAYALACVTEALGVGASVLWIAPAGLLIASALVGGTFMGLTALGLIRGRQMAPGDPRRTLAVLTAAFGVGQIIGPAFAGVVYDATGSLLAPSLTAVAGLLIAAGLIFRTGATT
jgi:MFS family permease